MLISGDEVISLLKKYGIAISGTLHVGAHDCEELPFYRNLGLSELDIVWIDAIPTKVQQAKHRGIQNIYQAVITDKDDQTVKFNVSNNVQSSSILEFGTHAKHHAHVTYVSSLELQTTTLKSFFAKHALCESKYDFWNFDIQGAELHALRGAGDLLKHVKALYLEVNTEEVYKGCALLSEIDAYVESFGFKRVRTEITPYGWGDALYLKI